MEDGSSLIKSSIFRNLASTLPTSYQKMTSPVRFSMSRFSVQAQTDCVIFLERSAFDLLISPVAIEQTAGLMRQINSICRF